MPTIATTRRPPTQLRLFAGESIRVHTSPGTICVGDLVRVSGGPSCNGQTICARGVYRVCAIVFNPRFKSRTWLDCVRLEPVWDVPVEDWLEGARFLLYAAGPVYRKKDFPSVIWRPFKVRKLKTEN